MRKFWILRRAPLKKYVLWCFGQQYGQSVKQTSKIYIFGNIMTVFYCYIVLVMCCFVGGLATFTTKTGKRFKCTRIPKFLTLFVSIYPRLTVKELHDLGVKKF